MAQKRRRLSRSAEFERVYRRGRSQSSRHLVLHLFPRERSTEGNGPAEEAASDAGGPRLGVSVGRRIGGAVMRNRVKRLLREAFWSISDSLPLDHDYVVVARADAAGLAEREGLAGIRADLERLVEQLLEEDQRGERGRGRDQAA